MGVSRTEYMTTYCNKRVNMTSDGGKKVTDTKRAAKVKTYGSKCDTRYGKDNKWNFDRKRDTHLQKHQRTYMEKSILANIHTSDGNGLRLLRPRTWIYNSTNNQITRSSCIIVCPCFTIGRLLSWRRASSSPAPNLRHRGQFGHVCSWLHNQRWEDWLFVNWTRDTDKTTNED